MGDLLWGKQDEVGNPPPNINGFDPVALRAGGGGKGASEGVRAASAVDDDGTAIPSGEAKATIAQSGGEGRAGIGCAPCGEGGGANISDGRAGTLDLGPFAWSLDGHGAAAVEEASGLHGVGNILATVLQQGLVNSPVVLALHKRQAAFVLDDPADFLPARVLMGEVGHLPVGLHKTVNEVVVRPVIFDVLNAAPLDVGEAELPFIMRHENVHDGLGIAAGWRINVNVVNRAIRPAMTRGGNELRYLAAKIRRDKVTGIKHPDLLTALAAQEMAGKGDTASASRRAGYHGTLNPSTSPLARSRALAMYRQYACPRSVDPNARPLSQAR